MENFLDFGLKASAIKTNKQMPRDQAKILRFFQEELNKIKEFQSKHRINPKTKKSNIEKKAKKLQKKMELFLSIESFSKDFRIRIENLRLEITNMLEDLYD